MTTPGVVEVGVGNVARLAIKYIKASGTSP
jgi:hypothetical protein